MEGGRKKVCVQCGKLLPMEEFRICRHKRRSKCRHCEYVAARESLDKRPEDKQAQRERRIESRRTERARENNMRAKYGATSTLRPCHDCGVLQTNYRCDDCWSRLDAKNGVSISDRHSYNSSLENNAVSITLR